MRVRVRPRVDADLDACADLVRSAHEIDGYPFYPPDDARRFLVDPTAFATWVAEVDGRVVGHVALHPSSSTQIMDLASEVTGVDRERMAFVARLVVSTVHRRIGVGRLLLRTAADAAEALGRRPLLDVHVRQHAALALYEGAGWTRAGTVVVRFSDGWTLEEHLYLGPAPGPSAS